MALRPPLLITRRGDWEQRRRQRFQGVAEIDGQFAIPSLQIAMSFIDASFRQVGGIHDRGEKLAAGRADEVHGGLLCQFRPQPHLHLIPGVEF